jgi:hypothetical protein
MKIFRLIILIISVLNITTEASLINDFLAGAKNLWPKSKGSIQNCHIFIKFYVIKKIHKFQMLAA